MAGMFHGLPREPEKGGKVLHRVYRDKPGTKRPPSILGDQRNRGQPGWALYQSGQSSSLLRSERSTKACVGEGGPERWAHRGVCPEERVNITPWPPLPSLCFRVRSPLGIHTAGNHRPIQRKPPSARTSAPEQSNPVEKTHF